MKSVIEVSGMSIEVAREVYIAYAIASGCFEDYAEERAQQMMSIEDVLSGFEDDVRSIRAI